MNPVLELTFQGHIYTKKNGGRMITRRRRGGPSRLIRVPSEAFHEWHRLELLSLIRQIPEVGAIARAVEPYEDFSDDSFKGEKNEGRLNDLVKGMREYQAVFPWPYRIEYDFYPGDLRLFDFTNAIESINDLLVDVRLIEDDSWFYLREPCPALRGFDRGKERCIVRLYCLPRGDAEDALEALRDDDAVRALAKAGKSTLKATRAALEQRINNGLTLTGLNRQ